MRLNLPTCKYCTTPRFVHLVSVVSICPWSLSSICPWSLSMIILWSHHSMPWRLWTHRGGVTLRLEAHGQIAESLYALHCKAHGNTAVSRDATHGQIAESLYSLHCKAHGNTAESRDAWSMITRGIAQCHEIYGRTAKSHHVLRSMVKSLGNNYPLQGSSHEIFHLWFSSSNIFP
jgi:hypothetical protein